MSLFTRRPRGFLQVDVAIMTTELILVILFGTLTFILGAIQIWIALHRYLIWNFQLRNNNSTRKNDVSSTLDSVYGDQANSVPMDSLINSDSTTV